MAPLRTHCAADRDGREFRAFCCVAGLALAVGLACGLARADDVDTPRPHSLFVMRRDGSDVRHVVHVEGYTSMASPRWSHDGQRLVFAARNTQGEPSRGFVVGVDGTGLRDLGPRASSDWSPDDKQFAFAAVAQRSDKDGIYVQNTNGRSKQYLSPGAAPRWSPDGSQIAFLLDGLKILDLIDSSTRSAFAADEKIERVLGRLRLVARRGTVGRRGGARQRGPRTGDRRRR